MPAAEAEGRNHGRKNEKNRRGGRAQVRTRGKVDWNGESDGAAAGVVRDQRIGVYRK